MRGFSFVQFLKFEILVLEKYYYLGSFRNDIRDFWQALTLSPHFTMRNNIINTIDDQLTEKMVLLIISY